MSLSPDHIAEAVQWRQHLHRHPELAFEEHTTSLFIAKKLAEWGLIVRRGYGRTGVVGTLSGGTSSRSIALRADMDALPIHESSGVAHQSTVPGIMHACGHDGHVATLLAAARHCAGLPLDGTAHFIFQPAEENDGGAREMVQDGLFNDCPADMIFALHNWPSLDTGACVARDGAMMAAFDTFEITVRGRGAHGAMPHEGADPIVAVTQIVSALQTIASRNVSPLEASVVSVTQIHGGDAWNVIPEVAAVRGTTRWFSDSIGVLLERRIVQLAQSVAAGFECVATVEYVPRYPATINHAAPAAFVRKVSAAQGLTVIDTVPSMAAEDFAFMLQAVPGCYFWLGSKRQGENPGLHSPRFDFNDDILGPGANLWVALVEASIGMTASA